MFGQMGGLGSGGGVLFKEQQRQKDSFSSQITNQMFLLNADLRDGGGKMSLEEWRKNEQEKVKQQTQDLAPGRGGPSYTELMKMQQQEVSLVVLTF